MIVVDTNIVAYLMIESDHTAQAIGVRRKDADWRSPGLWRSEFRNVMMLYVRRDIMTSQNAILRTAKAETLIETMAVNSDRIIELASQSGCTAYDCEFVSLAERLGVPLITSDKKILAAFPDIAISMDAFVS